MLNCHNETYQRQFAAWNWNWPFQCCYGNEMRSCDKHVAITSGRSSSSSSRPEILLIVSLLWINLRLPSFIPTPLSLPPPTTFAIGWSSRAGRRWWCHPPSPTGVRWKPLFLLRPSGVKSPLAEIRERCLLGPAALRLPHGHTWRALQRSPLGLAVTLRRTRCTVVASYCCMLPAPSLKGPLCNI